MHAIVRYGGPPIVTSVSYKGIDRASDLKQRKKFITIHYSTHAEHDMHMHDHAYDHHFTTNDLCHFMITTSTGRLIAML